MLFQAKNNYLRYAHQLWLMVNWKNGHYRKNYEFVLEQAVGLFIVTFYLIFKSDTIHPI